MTQAPEWIPFNVVDISIEKREGCVRLQFRDPDVDGRFVMDVPDEGFLSKDGAVFIKLGTKVEMIETPASFASCNLKKKPGGPGR